MQQRLDYIDAAKGLAICLMVFGHSGYVGMPHEVIYTFHMPLFFILSGLFVGRKEMGILDSINANTRSLLIPYSFMYLITIPFGLAFIAIKCGISLTITDCIFKPLLGMVYGVDHLLGGFYFFTNGPLWFLLALFLSRIWFDLVHTLTAPQKAKWGVYLLSAVISVGVYYVLKHLGLNIWSLTQACILYPYMLVGFALSRTNFLTKVGLISIIKRVLTGTILFLGVVLSTKYLGKIDYGSLLIGTYPVVSFCIAIIGTLAIVLFTSTVKIPWLCQLGKETLVILGFHHPIMDVTKFGLSKMGVDVFSYSLGICIIVSLITIVICHFAYLLLKRTVPFLIGIKTYSK